MSGTFWPDDLVDHVVATLQAAAPTAGITGFDATKVLDGDMLPTDIEDLPVIGVYIPEDKPDPQDPETSTTLTQRRIATIRVEIRATGANIRGATKALRQWALKTLMADETLGGKAQNCSFTACTFWGRASEKRMGGADLDFEASYFFNPES